MADNIDRAGGTGKETLADHTPGRDGPPAVRQIDILAPLSAAALTDAVTAVQRLARARIMPDALLAALDGPLSGAIATAAEYAGSALSEATKRAYGRDWFRFADWCRQQGVDPTALPIHPVLVAAYLASLAGTLGQSALNGRLAAIAYEHRRRGLAWNAGHPAIRETLQLLGPGKMGSHRAGQGGLSGQSGRIVSPIASPSRMVPAAGFASPGELCRPTGADLFGLAGVRGRPIAFMTYSRAIGRRLEAFKGPGRRLFPVEKALRVLGRPRFVR